MDVSVIFATRNRADLLADTLRELERQDTAGLTWEVIVVDNGSTDRTPEVLRAAASVLPLVHLVEPAPGKNRALNRALQITRGELLVFTDDDVIPDRRWIAEMVAAARRWPKHPIFGGQIVPSFPPGTPAWLKGHRFNGTAYARFNLPQGEGPMEKLPFGPNFMVRAATMRTVRYNEEIGPLGEDYVSGSETELLLRLTREGHRMVYVPTAIVGHVVRPNQVSVDWLLGRSYRLGRSYVELKIVQLEGKPKFAGVPVLVWSRLAREWIYSLLGAFGDEQHRFDHGVDYHFLRGCIRQQRLMLHRQRKNA
jgi:glycosyltransferase involved in cell wall biosynthesis